MLSNVHIEQEWTLFNFRCWKFGAFFLFFWKPVSGLPLLSSAQQKWQRMRPRSLAHRFGAASGWVMYSMRMGREEKKKKLEINTRTHREIKEHYAGESVSPGRQFIVGSRRPPEASSLRWRGQIRRWEMYQIHYGMYDIAPQVFAYFNSIAAQDSSHESNQKLTHFRSCLYAIKNRKSGHTSQGSLKWDLKRRPSPLLLPPALFKTETTTWADFGGQF